MKIGGATPYKHAAERPREIKERDLFNDVPSIINALATAGLDELSPFFEHRAHGPHPALIIPTQSLKPADPAVHLPSPVAPTTATAMLSIVRPHYKLGDHRLNEARRLLS